MHELDLNTGPLAGPWRDNTVGALYEIAKRAPGQPVALTLGKERMVLLQDVGQVRHVLREVGAKYLKNFGGFAGFFGESRISADGPRWEYLQSLSQPHISAARPLAVAEASERAFITAAEQIMAGRDSDGGVVVDLPLSRATTRVISDVAFGDIGVDVDLILEDFREILRFGSRRNWNFGGASVVESEDDRRRYANAKDRMVRYLGGILSNEARSQLIRDLAAGETNGADPVSEISTLLFAGFDTTAAALCWALFLLATAPELQARLRAELQDAVGQHGVTLEALEAVPDLGHFQNEVLRIFPPVPMLGRICVGGDAVDDIRIANDQRVILSIIGMHHDSRRFPFPAQIRLSRYKSDPPQGPHMAFGGGRRVCPGSRIANVEMAVALAVLLTRLEFSLADQAPIGFDFVASMRRLGGQRLLVREVGRQ